ncbi:MAG: hypothetical protein CME20_25200 [Gemmatimonadetes bacterium]|jgi:hypothetical protein|nr:hypothetical protein [Gemmatimonadota bacterium]|tara:strand:- start:292 stop:516 length:225 start_codon:yes stop_codon:yes gene_type:complete
MPLYRHPEATGAADELTVIEDPQMTVADSDTGLPQPGYAFIDPLTIKAHPLIIDALVDRAERVWSLDELLAAAA